MILKILEQEWGAWIYSDADGDVLFESDVASMAFNNAIMRIGELTLMFERLQREILMRQAGNGY